MGRYIYQDTIQDQHGNAVVSATVSVYLAGSSTAADIYEAISGGTAVNSVETDTAGKFVFFIDDSGYDSTQRFKIIMSKSGYTTKTWDYIEIIPESIETVESYGAVGDGETDDYEAIAEAYAAALAAGGGIIKFSNKTYKINSTIGLGLEGNLDIPIIWEGVGGNPGTTSGGTILDCSSISSGHALFEQNQGDYVYNHVFRNFGIRAATSGVGDADAFRLAYINNFHFDYLTIYRCAVAFNLVDQDIDRVTWKRCKFYSNGQDILIGASGAGYQLHFEDMDFGNTQSGASINTKSGCNVLHVRFDNCSWVQCQYEAVKIENGSNIKQFTLDTAYSEQCCETSGDYAFDFLASIQGLRIQDCGLSDNHPTQAEMRITTARSALLIGNNLGIDDTIRALDLGDGTGDIYGPILIGNTLWDDSGGDVITVLGSSTLRNLVMIGNIPNDVGLDPVFSISNWYSENNIGVFKVDRIETLADDATPSVKGSNVWLTGGTTTITDFDDGVTGQEIKIIAEHSLTITDGTDIFLNGSTDFEMTATDTLTLIQKADGKWYELSRGDNGA